MTSGIAAAPAVEVEHGPLSPRLADAWDELARATGALPFAYPGWHTAWADAFARGRLVAVTARRRGELVGVAPVVCGSGVVRASANWHTPRYGFVTADDDAAEALASFLVAGARRRVDLTMLEAGEPALAAIRRAARTAGRATIERTVAHQPYVDVARDVDEYHASLKRKLRKELARLERRTRDLGELAVTVADGSAGLDALLDDGFRLEASGWKHEHGDAVESSPPVRAFYTQVARWAAARGWLRLAFLRLDGEPVAFDYCLEAGGALHVLKGGFDPEYRKLGPGMLLTWGMLRRACEGDARSYELLGDADPYKLSWTDRTRAIWRVQVFGSGALGRLDRLAWSRGRPLAKRLLAAAGR